MIISHTQSILTQIIS